MANLTETIKYITVLEIENPECCNVGTISTENINQSFKKAVEGHFDAEMISFSFVDKEVENLDDCINATPIDVIVTLDVGGDDYTYKLELSQTWLY